MDCPHSKQPCNDASLNDDGYVELHMCKKCADSHMTESDSASVVKDLISVFIAILTKRTDQSNSDSRKCPSCGVTPKYIYENKKFGCEKCYEYYQASIEHILKKCQGGKTKHVGKVPKQYAENQKSNKKTLVEDEIINLEHKMAKAIMLENYEVAGVLKQKIQELRQQFVD